LAICSCASSATCGNGSSSASITSFQASAVCNLPSSSTAARRWRASPLPSLVFSSSSVSPSGERKVASASAAARIMGSAPRTWRRCARRSAA
jgi:hypothetical protein